MSIVKNLHLLTGIDDTVLERIETAATLHKRYASIIFKIKEVSGKVVTMQIAQGESSYNNYFSPKRLHAIAHETFDSLLPGYTLHIHPIAFKQSTVNLVTSAWIKKKMHEKDTKVKDIANDTGISFGNSYTIPVRPVGRAGIVLQGQISQVQRAVLFSKTFVPRQF